ncbi:hypothetical protein CcrC1_gp226c [Caulobacter phage C1]|nr:hypothetical protein CcrC1_gp226c [Caulobacter phage C1]UTU08455.1 hypothetical protein CcrC2_gp227c [Caulobacter phage C2]UTU08972.1 hypothetical protein CcrJ4_gp221c [Caulobacter phage J4]UTU09531.1 hypothetical protein CcrBL47_gp245c [Caulobacter phage BL47]UTU10088.1 hypothetical protein CcrRB23_gp226c [Caulobacter phage RB23]WGN97123.1 hypothetical protein [Bertelyvirus sp.]
MQPSLIDSGRTVQTLTERDEALARYDVAGPEERRCWNDFTPMDIKLALIHLHFSMDEADWSLVWNWCHSRYRSIEELKIKKGAQALEEAIQRSSAAEVVQPNGSSARERLRRLSLARPLSRPSRLRAA